jgi:trehalose 6-phosphate phosphatase
MIQRDLRVVTVERDELIPQFDFRRAALLLDIDGTLLDIAPTPEAVTVPNRLMETIEVLFQRASGALAFISGRRIATIDRLFAPLKLPSVGCHGAEFRARADGEIDEAVCLPEPLKRRIIEIAGITPGIRVEDKVHTIALHFRHAPGAGPALMRALVEQRAALMAADLQLLSGKAVIEIKPRWFNKGTGVSRLMRHPPFFGRVPVFLGDDTTDQDVFRMLPEYDGLGYAVGRNLQGAAFTFESPRDVRNWLTRLAAG